MSSNAPEHAATNPSRRQDPAVPSIQEKCPHCHRMQELNLQLGLIADAEHNRAEAYKKLYEEILVGFPSDLSRAA